jgi:hypothetical protein
MINFNDIDDFDNNPLDFDGYERFRSFLEYENILDEYITNIKHNGKDIKEFLSRNACVSYISGSFPWKHKEYNKWKEIHIKWLKNCRNNIEYDKF